MRGIRELATALCLTLVVSGCGHRIYTFPVAAEKSPKTYTHAAYLFGLIGGGPINMEQQCDKGPARLEIVNTFMDVLLSGVTLFIYLPTTVTVDCSKGGGAESDGGGKKGKKKKKRAELDSPGEGDDGDVDTEIL